MPKYMIECDASAHPSNLAERFLCVARCCRATQWIDAYITDHRVYAIYITNDYRRLRFQLQQHGIKVKQIALIRAQLDPSYLDSMKESLIGFWQDAVSRIAHNSLSYQSANIFFI